MALERRESSERREAPVNGAHVRSAIPNFRPVIPAKAGNQRATDDDTA